MKLYFTEQELAEGVHKIEIEDVMFEAEWVEKGDCAYITGGKAIIDGEIYRDFKVEFILAESTDSENASEILNRDWEEYDFMF